MSEAIEHPVQITLDELPRYSSWPKRLLALEHYAIRRKTEAEVLREYQDDKWGSLLARVRCLDNPTLLDVERANADLAATAPCYHAGNFYLASNHWMLNLHLDLYAEVLAPYLENASCVVELGAGFGSKLFGLGFREAFSKMPLIAAEYTQSGRDLISILAKVSGKPVAIGQCDFWKLQISDITIPENAVIFTSCALHYVSELSFDLVAFISRLKPRVVVHFEPCYEHYDAESFHGLMCRRYVQLNDYTVNLAAVIQAGRDREGISVRTRLNVMGSNPFLPISVVEWVPSARSRS